MIIRIEEKDANYNITKDNIFSNSSLGTIFVNKHNHFYSMINVTHHGMLLLNIKTMTAHFVNDLLDEAFPMRIVKSPIKIELFP